MNPLFQGYWTVPSSSADLDEILYISSTGIYVHQIIIEADPLRYVPMKLWLRHEEGDTYRVIPQKKLKGWSITMMLHNDDLMIERSEKTFRCKRLEEEKVPKWFNIELQKILFKMEAESIS